MEVHTSTNRYIRFIGAMLLLAGLQPAAEAQLEHLDSRSLARYTALLEQHAAASSGALQTHLKAVPRNLPLAVANAARVADDLIAAAQGDAALAVYAVPAMSDRMRLHDSYPADGRVDTPVRIIAARGEYEPASFVVYPLADYGKATFTLAPLQSAAGHTFPLAQLDLRVVKVWYQNGNGWISYFMDTGLELTPELLLYDEELISVDTVAKANYARVRNADGSFRQQWITPPKNLDSIYDEQRRGAFYTFRPMKDDFEDATTLQPVRLEAGSFKQFWLTAHVTSETPPGLYQGAIEVTAADGTKLAAIPLALRVLPFELPEPKTYFDIERDLLVSSYNYVSFPLIMDQNGGDRALAAKQFLGIFKNMRRHNLYSPKLRGSQDEDQRQTIKLMQEAGLRTDLLIGSSMRAGSNSEADGLAVTRRQAAATREFFESVVGHHNVYLQSGDENPAAWVVKMRPHWKIYQEHGFKLFTAGSPNMYYKGGYVYDMHPGASFPENAEYTRKWNEIGDSYVAWYASQHVGVENPAYIRKQYGLVPYRSNFSLLMNYAFSMYPWNDLAKDTYKPMVFAYCTRGELIDTMAWEGFREGVDDIRYATLLRQLALEMRDDRANPERRYTARKALQYLADVDTVADDFNAVRLELIERILALLAVR